MRRTPSALPALLNGMAGEVDLINNDLKVPYSDQFSLGMRNRLGDWNTSAAVTRIDSKDGFVFTLGNRYPNGDFWQNRSQPWGNSPPGLAGALLIGNSGIETKSTQVLLSAEKPFTEDIAAGARRSRTRTRTPSRIATSTSTTPSTRSSIKEYPFILSNAAAKHRVVATGSFAAPVGTDARGQADLVDAHSAQRDLLPGAIRDLFPTTARPAPRSGYAAGRQRRLSSRSTCRSRRTSNWATWDRCTCASTSST